MGSFENIINQEFGTWRAVKYNGNSYWECECTKCGERKIIHKYSLKKRTPKCTNCDASKVSKISVGAKFGEWEVISEMADYKVKCRCSCGKEREINIYTLLSGRSTSCGHTMNKDRVRSLTGQRFDKLVAVKYLGDSLWECKCNCGNTVTKERSHLLDGRSRSCGCDSNKLKDITGQRFGKLVAVKYMGNKHWLCRCDCGNTKLIRSANLLNNSTISCGCMLNYLTKDDIQSKINKFISEKGTKPTILDLANEFGLSYKSMGYHLGKYPELSDMLYKSFRSRYETEIVNELIHMGLGRSDIVHNKLGLAGKYEADIWIPSANLVIEFNGAYWYSDIHKYQKYHQDKLIAFVKSGIDVINIFEYEWNDDKKREKIIKLLNNRLTNNASVYKARELLVEGISNGDAKEFCNRYHLQSGIDSTYNIGLKTKSGELLGIMTFGKSRFNEDIIEMYRLCYKHGIRVIGGSARMFKYFTSNNPSINRVVSYCDISKFNGNGYIKFGFKVIGITKPDYVWTDGESVLNRINTQKHKLINAGLGTPEDTESGIMTRLGYYRVWGCGNLRLEWVRESSLLLDGIN